MYLKYLFPISLFAALLVGCNSGTSKRTGEHSKKDNNSKTDQMKSAYSHWLGSWQRTEWQNDAGLDIDSIVLDTLVFHLGASNGGNSGEIEGSAKINGNKAAYFSDEDGDSCMLEFEISGDTLIVVNQVKGDCFAGSGVEYSGKYYSTKIKPSSTKEENEEDLLSLGRFNNPQDDSLFRALTGKDYDLFVSSTQLTSDDSDQDNFNARFRLLVSGDYLQKWRIL